MYDVLTLQKWVRDLFNSFGVDSSAMWIEPFMYTMTFAAFNGVSGNANAQLSINANAHFVLTEINYAATLGTAITAATQPRVQARLQLVDAGSSRPFFNTAAMLDNFCGTQSSEQFMPYPRWLSANTAISGQLVAYGTAAETFSQIDVSFLGVAVRQYSPPIQAVTLV